MEMLDFMDMTARRSLTSGHVATRPAGDAAPAFAPTEHERVLQEVRRLLGTLRFGSVTLIVLDGRVVQVESTSKLRLTASSSSAGNGRGT